MARSGHYGLITSIAALRERCKVDPVSLCWEWQGATRGGSRPVARLFPVVYAYDHATGEKRGMSGPAAAWNIAHGEAPRPGHRVFRACGNCLCLNPVHLRQARNAAEIGQHQRRSGTLRGKNVEQHRASLAKARAAQGIVSTPIEIVRAIRSADASITGRELARRFGMSDSAVSRIRLGQTHKEAA